MMTLLKIGGAVALLWYLEQQKHPDGNVLLSSNVVKDGKCVRVDVLKSGGTRNVPVPMSECNADADDKDLDNVFEDPNLGFNRLIHLFDE